MVAKMTSSDFQEFERMASALFRPSGVTMVLMKDDSTVCLREDGEMLYDFGDGIVRRMFLDKHKLLNTIEELIHTISQDDSQG